jgi:hypothetical protein
MGSLMWDYISRSTLKREAASVLMLWLLGEASYLIADAGAPAWDQKLQVMNIFALPIMGLFLGAFGADYLAKQTNVGGPPSPGPTIQPDKGTQ